MSSSHCAAGVMMSPFGLRLVGRAINVKDLVAVLADAALEFKWPEAVDGGPGLRQLFAELAHIGFVEKGRTDRLVGACGQGIDDALEQGRVGLDIH